MRSKTIVNSKGEQIVKKIEIKIKGTGGETGKKANVNLISLINGLKEMKTQEEITTHYLIIAGFATCCEVCGFMSEESTNEVMHLVEYLVEKELARAAAHD